jgi:hypothetical protein
MILVFAAFSSTKVCYNKLWPLNFRFFFVFENLTISLNLQGAFFWIFNRSVQMSCFKNRPFCLWVHLLSHTIAGWEVARGMCAPRTARPAVEMRKIKTTPWVAFTLNGGFMHLFS